MAIGFLVDSEVSPFADGMGGFLSIDMANRERMIAIEFDGPSHFLSDHQHNGPTKFKTRLLEALGWQVLRIDYLKWDGLKGGERAQFLTDALQTMKNREPPSP